MIAFQRRLFRLKNAYWVIRQYRDRYGWKAVFQKAIGRFLRLGKHMIPIFSIMFGWRNTLSRQKPILISLEGSTFSIVPQGAAAFHIWSHLGFEQHEIELVVGLLHRDMVFLDIGSNAGLFALPAALKLKKEGGGAVYAFEPTISTFQLLTENVHINRLDDLVTAICTALGDWAGTATLSVNAPGKNGLNTLGHPTHPDVQIVTQEQVPIITLDGWLAENGVQRVDLIKMDVEGAELKILQGASRLLHSANAPIIFYESHTFTTAGFNYHPVEIIWCLEEYGYQVYFFDKGRIIPRPPSKYNGMMVAAKPLHLPSLKNFWGGE